ncbi:hypothetical protein A0H81_02547 [Grifola frondosa]|uniref:Amine oxidase domain-containing protein n=1 Tax=Grifola frondosa TaxID=5627 RepID=A0A1C7MMF5_GRIFR|nr:hypothetical protein A0H81_02547 [Grifola frondosa]
MKPGILTPIPSNRNLQVSFQPYIHTSRHRAWLELTKQDYHSVRGYMLSGKKGKPRAPPYPVSIVDHFAHSWDNDEHTRGAFALCGLAKFGQPDDAQSMFAAIKAPAAGGQLHFAGEATSAHHARPEKQKLFIKRWRFLDEERTRRISSHFMSMTRYEISGPLQGYAEFRLNG